MNERIARGGGTLFKIIVALLGALLVMGIVLEFTEHTGFVFGVGGLTALLLGRWLFGRRPVVPVAIPDAAVPASESSKPPAQPYRIIFTHDEAVLDRTEFTIAGHPQVQEGMIPARGTPTAKPDRSG